MRRGHDRPRHARSRGPCGRRPDRSCPADAARWVEPLSSRARNAPETRRPRGAGSRAWLLALAIPVAAVLPSAAAPDGTAPNWITLLHTNDIHGEFAPRPLERRNGALTGGFVALAARVEEVRKSGPTLLLDAGDLMTGTPLTTLDYNGVLGGAAIEFMNLVGYDAMALGNHEFDHGRDACTALMRHARFPVLCANISDSTSGQLFAGSDRGAVVLERGGVRVAVIGLILDDLRRMVGRTSIAGLMIAPSIAVAREEVARLDPESDLIVVLTHQGLDASRNIARAVKGIDVIVAGHDHRWTTKPIKQSGVLIVEAGSRLERLGQLKLRVADDRVADFEYQLEDLAAGAPGEGPESVRRLAAEMDQRVQADFGQVLAELVTPFVRDERRESNVGDWVTDALRRAARADFAVTNSSGIRTNVASGPLTKRDLYGVAPFPNVLVTFQATGSDLSAFARRNARIALGREPKEHGIVQVSGLEYAYDPRGEVTALAVGGQPVEPDRIYVGASHDYLVLSQAERYLGFEPRAVQATSEQVLEILYAAARAEGRIDARIEGRIRGPAREEED